MGQSDGKTEKATPQRRQKARSEGQVARSAEIGVAAGLAAMALGLRVFTPAAIDVLQRETATLFTASSQAVSLGLVGRSATTMMLALGAPLVAVGTGAAVVAGVGQVGLKPTPKAARPKLSHLSPKRGLERLKPATAGWELVRSVLKLGLLAAVIWGPLVAWQERVGRDRGLDAGLARVLEQTWTLLLRGVLLAVAIAALDYAWNRRKLGRDLRMSTEDIKQDRRAGPGHRRRRRRRAARRRARCAADAPGHRGGRGVKRRQYATFLVADWFLGVEVGLVQEVIRYQEMTRVPLASPVVAGLINLRGQIVTAIDLRRRLGLPDRLATDPSVLPANVVPRTDDGVVSLLVDEIGDVREVGPDSFEEPPPTLTGIARELIRGAHTLDRRLLLLLDTDRIVAIDQP